MRDLSSVSTCMDGFDFTGDLTGDPGIFALEDFSSCKTSTLLNVSFFFFTDLGVLCCGSDVAPEPLVLLVPVLFPT